MYTEDEYLSLSGIQHLCFCPRQCALIHVEQLWTENFFTAHGRAIHEKVHGGPAESRKGIRTERELRISSSVLGLYGQTDAVEFYKEGIVIPVEYKRGKPKSNNVDAVQLCAQAICLEEMLNMTIEKGYLFYNLTKKRQEVIFTSELRQETQNLADQYHDLIKAKKTPFAIYEKRCESCSFVETCFPKTAGKGKSVTAYLERNL